MPFLCVRKGGGRGRSGSRSIRGVLDSWSLPGPGKAKKACQEVGGAKPLRLSARFSVHLGRPLPNSKISGVS